VRRVDEARFVLLERGDAASIVRALVHEPVRVDALRARALLDRHELDEGLATVRVEDGWALSDEWLAALRDDVHGRLRVRAEASPLDPGMSLAEVLPPEPWASTVLPLLGLERREGKAYLPGAAASLGDRTAAATALEEEDGGEDAPERGGLQALAAREAVGRASRRYRGILLDAWLTMAATCFLVGGIVTQVVVGVEPWYDPRYVIPLLGMILGNSLTGISLCLDRFMDHLETRSAEVELRIAYGASRREALAAPLKDAVRTGMIPIINSMAAAGIVSLPGMMTGVILGGSDPRVAVMYQIAIMIAIFTGTNITVVLGILLSRKTAFDAYGVLRRDIFNK